MIDKLRVGKHKAAIAAAALALGLFAGPGLAMTAMAQVGFCRSDPVVTLSNGAAVVLYEDISDSPTDVSKITYQLHVPVGVTVVSVAYAGAVPANLQSITTTADENSGNYDAYTTVDTGTQNAPVTAYMSASGTVSCHTSGHSHQQLHSHLHLH